MKSESEDKQQKLFVAPEDENRARTSPVLYIPGKCLDAVTYDEDSAQNNFSFRHLSLLVSVHTFQNNSVEDCFIYELWSSRTSS